jgi:hypothetical protein
MAGALRQLSESELLVEAMKASALYLVAHSDCQWWAYGCADHWQGLGDSPRVPRHVCRKGLPANLSDTENAAS